MYVTQGTRLSSQCKEGRMVKFIDLEAQFQIFVLAATSWLHTVSRTFHIMG